MTNRNFEEWLKSFTDNINNWNYYVNYNTAYKNTASVKRQLALLNTLKGSQDIEEEFKDLVADYPECIKAIPLLLAVRENIIAITENDRRLDFNFNNMNYDIDLYVEFMHKTGIFDLLQSHVIGDLLDVGLGINIGLDSNARKNRGGDQMEDLVEFFIKEAGFEKDVTYFKEMYLHEVEQKWGYNLSAISADGVAKKRFDFVVKPVGSTILGKKVVISEFMPDAENGNKPIAFGDFSYYWIVDRKATSISTLVELFAELGQIGYLAYKFLDAKLIRKEAIKVIQMGKVE